MLLKIVSKEYQSNGSIIFFSYFSFLLFFSYLFSFDFMGTKYYLKVFFNLVTNICLNKNFYLIGGFVSNYHIEMEAVVDGKIFTPIAGHQPPQVENLNCF